MGNRGLEGMAIAISVNPRIRKPLIHNPEAGCTSQSGAVRSDSEAVRADKVYAVLWVCNPLTGLIYLYRSQK